MKRIVQKGDKGGITDINVKITTTRDTIIDYTDVNSTKIFYPKDCQQVDLPHDWCVESTFVNDNSLGNQPAANGYLPTSVDFYRKEFGIRESDLSKKKLIEFDGIFRNSTAWVNGYGDRQK